LPGLETQTRYRYRVTAYPLEGDDSLPLPTPVASSSTRAGADIATGDRGDNQYNSGNLSVASGSSGSVAVELYGTGYQDVAGFTATIELSNPGAVKSVSMNAGSAFPIKLSEPTITGSTRIANLGTLSPTSSPGADLIYLGTVVINLQDNVGNGLGITVSTISFQSAGCDDRRPWQWTHNQ
jgi:hypothetical protein